MSYDTLHENVAGYTELRPENFYFSSDPKLKSYCPSMAPDALMNRVKTLFIPNGANSFIDQSNTNGLMCRNNRIYTALMQLQNSSANPAGNQDINTLYNDKLKLIVLYFLGILVMLYLIYYFAVPKRLLPTAAAATTTKLQ